jgi:hypothetical protein
MQLIGTRPTPRAGGVTVMVRYRSVVRSAAVELLGHADTDGRLSEDTGQVFGGQSEANAGPRASGRLGQPSGCLTTRVGV